MSDFIIRDAAEQDAKRLLEIYAHYVTHTAITFEYDVPTLEEFAARIRNTQKKYPYFVAEKGGQIIGYAYAGAFHPRAAYGWCAEASVYLAKDAQGQGAGRKLYEALEAALRAMGVLNLYACIACPQGEDDEYLTSNSARFHAHMGYRLCGTFSRCGYKFGRWYNMIWMEKIIGEHAENQLPVRSYPDVRA